MSDDEQFGKKVFFLYPHGVIAEVANILAQAEYEVYLVRDHRKLKVYLARHPSSIVFVNIDEGQSEPDWENWIHDLLEGEATKPVGIGVVTMTGDPELSKKYLLDIGLSCGFVVVKVGVAKTAEIMLKTLEANEARGRRKYVRIPCPEGQVEFSVKDGDKDSRGEVIDVSVAGMSCRLQDGRSFAVGSRLRDLHLSLKGVPVFMTGVVIGERKDADSGVVQVVMFEPASLTEEKREKIRAFGRRVMQARMDFELANS